MPSARAIGRWLSPLAGRRADMLDKVVAESGAGRRALAVPTDVTDSAQADRLIARTVEVLVEGVSKRNAARWFGRTGTNKVVVFTPAPEIKVGDLVEIEIRRATSMTLFGP